MLLGCMPAAGTEVGIGAAELASQSHCVQRASVNSVGGSAVTGCVEEAWPHCAQKTSCGEYVSSPLQSQLAHALVESGVAAKG